MRKVKLREVNSIHYNLQQEEKTIWQCYKSLIWAYKARARKVYQSFWFQMILYDVSSDQQNSGYFIMWPNIGYKVAVFNNLVKFVQYLWCIFHICVMHVQYFVVYTPVFDILVWYTPMYPPPPPNPESVPGMPADLIILVQTSLINKTIMLSKELQSSTRDLEIDTLSRDFITLSQLFKQKG